MPSRKSLLHRSLSLEPKEWAFALLSGEGSDGRWVCLSCVCVCVCVCVFVCNGGLLGGKVKHENRDAHPAVFVPKEGQQRRVGTKRLYHQRAVHKNPLHTPGWIRDRLNSQAKMHSHKKLFTAQDEKPAYCQQIQTNEALCCFGSSQMQYVFNCVSFKLIQSRGYS